MFGPVDIVFTLRMCKPSQFNVLDHQTDNTPSSYRVGICSNTINPRIEAPGFCQYRRLNLASLQHPACAKTRYL